MTYTNNNEVARAIETVAQSLQGTKSDYDALLNMIGEARFALIGEASHGTREFYQERAEITKRLIQEKGITAVAVEADWPDAYRVNRYVRGMNDDANARDALGNFQRFPTWMWRNKVVLDFIEWLRRYNTSLAPDQKKTGFYGLDLYSLYRSMNAVINYLEKVDHEAAQRARERYACLMNFGENSQSYGYRTRFNLSKTCEDEVVKQLLDLQQHTANYTQRDGGIAEDEFFYAEQNARLTKNAEEYYRAMFSDSISSWNLRDRHMADTLDALMAHLDRYGGPTKIAVWEHNSHLGDARATEMGAEGEYNVGQLVRERHGQDCALIGFTTYHGRVTAATNWDGPAENKQLRPALPDSYEYVFHESNIPRFSLLFHKNSQALEALQETRLERAVGVIYRPETERASHYFQARLLQQFDAVIHLDKTHALEPLERTPQWQPDEIEETFPFGV